MTAALADAHLHLFSHGYPGRYGRGLLGGGSDIEAYERLRSAHGIAAGLVIGYEAGGIDPDNNRYIRTLADRKPWMSTVAYVEARSSLTPCDAERLCAAGHAGIALYVADAAAARTVAQWPAEAWQLLEEWSALVSLNATPDAMEDLAPTITARPGCRFLFSHLGLPGRHAAVPGGRDAAIRQAPLLRLATCQNVFVKLSGLYAVSDPPHAYPHAAAGPFVELLLDHFGPTRCLWGSDFSPCLDFVSFAQSMSLPWLERLAPVERDNVMGGTLLGLLGRAGKPGEAV